MEKKTEIDWRQTVGEEDLDDVIEPLSGVYMLLDGLIRTNDDGYTPTTKDAYRALQIVCEHVEEELKKMKPKLDYMDTKMREVRDGITIK